MAKDLDILRLILEEELEKMEPAADTFEDDPMGFILRKYKTLNDTLMYLMTPSFQEYLTGIYIVAPKPTTFKIVLHNNEYFYLTWEGKIYEASVNGKVYYLESIGEKERCMIAISRLLRHGNPLNTKGPEGAEKGTETEEKPESQKPEAPAKEEAPEETNK
jgi:hypothetical protein